MPPLPYSSPPSPPFGFVTEPFVPSPIRERPNSAAVGALIALSTVLSTACNGDALAASVARYDVAPELSACTKS